MSKRTREDVPRHAAADTPDAAPRPWYRRLPWIATLVTIAVILSGGFQLDPVRDAATLGAIAEAALARPMAYVALAPLSDTLDALTLLSVRQHVALVLGAAVLFLLWRALRAWRGRATLRSHAIAVAVGVALLVATYGAVAVLPRPMARLEAADAHVLLLDFHSHTSASHDGRGGWSVEKNRAWHRAAGYDVAYVTDHASVAAAEQGMAANPNPVSEGGQTTILQGIEVTWSGEHVSILGAERTYKGLLTDDKRDMDEQSLRLASLIPGREPVVVWHHARDLARLPFASGPGTAGVRAIEIVNGAPDGMDQVRPKRARIVALAERHDVPLTVGSDNHGWGRTAPGWTLMRIYGWRGMTPDSLATNIERVFRDGGYRSTRAVERRVPDAETTSALAATVFTAPVMMLRMLSVDERVAWLVWTWLIAAAWMLARRRRGS